MPNKGMLRIGVAAVSVLASMALAIPAQALTDSAVDGFGRDASFDTIFVNQSVADEGTMPENPTTELPDTVSEQLPDDATVVSPELAVTEDGEVKNLETGTTVTSEELVGTEDTQPDPLAKTDGESFIPVEVGEVKDAVEQAEKSEAKTEGASADTEGVVRPASLQGNQYGAYWGTYNNTPAFFESDGTLFAQQAKGVIDVSEWQGAIDWQAAKNAGVEGAIIRISYGWGNGFDEYALRNISECKRLGIPFGVYSYSYSYDKASAAAEGADIVNLLQQAGVSPSDLSYPVYYDLERWTWTGHTPPTDPAVYDQIVNAWYGQLQAAGYNNLSVYSYAGYLSTALNSSNIHSKTRWIASYGPVAGETYESDDKKIVYQRFVFSSNDRGWQYTSSGQVAGIEGNVDLNAFGNAVAVSHNESTGNTSTVSGLGNQYYFSNRLEGGEADNVVFYGRSSDEVLAGDWDGDGRDTLAVRRGNAYYVKNEIATGEADQVVYYGRADDDVLVGDWDGDGRDTLAVRRGTAFFIANAIKTGSADKQFYYGREGDAVLVGDWNGDRIDTFCVRR